MASGTMTNTNRTRLSHVRQDLFCMRYIPTVATFVYISAHFSLPTKHHLKNSCIWRLRQHSHLKCPNAHSRASVRRPPHQVSGPEWQLLQYVHPLAKPKVSCTDRELNGPCSFMPSSCHLGKPITVSVCPFGLPCFHIGGATFMGKQRGELGELVQVHSGRTALWDETRRERQDKRAHFYVPQGKCR